MKNVRFIYRTTLMVSIALIAMFICCVAFIGCPEAEEMTDDVITPSTDDTPPPPPTDDTPPPPPPTDDTPPPPPEDDTPPPPPSG